jgi:hypothetical protein
MVEKPADLLAILERCIIENSDEAWSGFLFAFGPLIRRVYHAHADSAVFSDFESWFPGWLFYERKLHFAYRGLQAKVHGRECLTVEDKEKYLSNYFASIVRAAVAEFARERHPKAEAQAPESIFAAIPAPQPGDGQELHNDILEALQHLPPELRVPFWLRYYAALGPLTATDTAWAADQIGVSAERVAEMVLQEADANRRHQKPLSSEFIGSLLNIPPCTDGRYSTVDQRVRRAIVRIHEHLAKAPGERDE